MGFKEIFELIEAIDKSEISLMELKYEDLHLKLDKSLNRSETILKETIATSNDLVKMTMDSVVSENFNNEPISDNSVVEVEDGEFDYITSPMVGTVYLASAPGKPLYVSKGKHIEVGDVVCIVEAMKLMNEIESEFSGEIHEILVENGKMVEFGQKMFKIRIK